MHIYLNEKKIIVKNLYEIFLIAREIALLNKSEIIKTKIFYFYNNKKNKFKNIFLSGILSSDINLVKVKQSYKPIDILKAKIGLANIIIYEEYLEEN